MKILNREVRQCPCCGEMHEVQLVQEEDKAVFKGVEVEYIREFEYCETTDYTNETEELMDKNDAAIKDAYRLKMGLMTSKDIKALRKQYGLSQVDLCILLGFGKRTVTRYETCMVQTVSHDLMLRKLMTDAGWFLCLLERHQELSSYDKYMTRALALCKERAEQEASRYCQDPSNSGHSVSSADLMNIFYRYFSDNKDS